ncbi:MAG: NapC/NirT family cytochrome c [Gemmatimonadota bacterium]
MVEVIAAWTEAGTGLQEIPESLTSPFPLVTRISIWLFQLPSVIQVPAALAGAVVLLWLGRKLWKEGPRLWGWARSRSTALQIGFVVLGVVALTVVSMVGMSGYNYTQHSNDFCVSCHVMDDAFTRFGQSEHAEEGCHDCHQQPISASLRQVALWVLERPTSIGSHAPVPNQVCMRCHVEDDPDETWQRISATAGHRVHLESDSTVLENVQCVKCHAREIHHFVPTAETCGQSECHDNGSVDLVLGGMSSDTTSLHCVICHEFTAPVSESAPRSDAFGRLIPDSQDCQSCHEMEGLPKEFDIEQEPHQGTCGYCHNPHVQEEPSQAYNTCTNAGCHEQPEQLSAFHRDEHAQVANDCGACHEEHRWEAPIRCDACHEDPLRRR